MADKAFCWRCGGVFRVFKILLVVVVVLIFLQYGINLNFVYLHRNFKKHSIVSFGLDATSDKNSSDWGILPGFHFDFLYQKSKGNDGKGLCSSDTSKKGRIPVVQTGDLSISHLEQKFPEVKPGGEWRPTSCQAVQKIAVIVPYRDRAKELSIFLNHMHPFLQRQQLEYKVFIIEQNPGIPFNRGMLFNIGFLEATSKEEYDCVILHDVDVLPEDDRILYTCPTDNPRHLSAACSRWGYRLKYQTIFGGVTSFRPRVFQRVNGYSNGYFGWGAEDDDLYKRVVHHGFQIQRYPLAISRYRTLDHKPGIPNHRRGYYLIRADKRFEKEGLNSAVYSVLHSEEHKLYTNISVHINQSVIMRYVEALLTPPTPGVSPTQVLLQSQTTESKISTTKVHLTSSVTPSPLATDKGTTAYSKNVSITNTSSPSATLTDKGNSASSTNS